MRAADPSGECDLVVVGAGIVGLGAAREMMRRHPDLDVRVIEREPAIGAHQTGHNSGVVHAGIYYTPGSLKARLCVEGARELYEYCEARDIPIARSGKVIVATNSDELAKLDDLEQRGRANQVPGLRRLRGEEIAEVEPHVTGVAALHSPNTGVVDYPAVARAFAHDVRDGGGVVATGCGVKGAALRNGRLHVVHERGETRARQAVFCAGAWADRLAVAAGAPEDPRIIPFRGAWLRLRPERRELVRSLVYPVPDPNLPFLGVHLSRHIDGEVLIGPSALLVGALDAYKITRLNRRDLRAILTWPGTYKVIRKFWKQAAAEAYRAAYRPAFVADAARFVPELRPHDVLPGELAGVRAQAMSRDGKLVDDFVVSETERALHVRNAPSPAATSALALSRLIADRIEAATKPV